MAHRIHLTLAFALLAIALTLLSLHFFDWPPNRDLTTYATIARELRQGETLYVDVWDIKPPAIFLVYGLAQATIESPPLQFFILRLVPSLLVLAALVRAGRDAGFGDVAGVVSGLFWVVLSGDVRYQMHEANTEVFINACVAWAFVLFLRLQVGSALWLPLAIGLLFAVATLFKTVALAIAGLLGVAHLACPPSDVGRAAAIRQLLAMAAGGVAALGLVVLYFAQTDRFEAFREVMVEVGAAYAGDVWANLAEGVTLTPVLGLPPALGLLVAALGWSSLALLAWQDRQRRRAWILLGAYALGALVAVALPGKFYPHYWQLLMPPMCLGLGWLTSLFAGHPTRAWRLAPPLLLGALLLLLAVRGSRDYVASAPERLSGTFGEIHLESQRLGRRLGRAMTAQEVLYQVGEETGLYWFSGKRPTATIGVVQLVQWPQAARLVDLSLQALPADPPALIVVANRLIEGIKGHPVFDWIEANYRPVEPDDPGERKFFTFYVPIAADQEFVRRMLLGGRPDLPS